MISSISCLGTHSVSVPRPAFLWFLAAVLLTGISACPPAAAQPDDELFPPLSPRLPADRESGGREGTEDAGDSRARLRELREVQSDPQLRGSRSGRDAGRKDDTLLIRPERRGGSPEPDLAFDWRTHRVTVADLSVLSPDPAADAASAVPVRFQHGQPELTDAESLAYGELLQAIDERRFAAQHDAAGDVLAEQSQINRWESAFYGFEQARRMAWQNGTLQVQRVSRTVDAPFSASDPPVNGSDRLISESSDSRLGSGYSLRDDMSSHPSHFVGRPVVMYGLYSPSGQVELPVIESGTSDRLIRLQRGFLRNLTDTETLAIVDATGYLGPGNQSVPEKVWPAERGVTIPVLVKGWFVKLWGSQPLILTEAVRILTPRPYDQLITKYARQRAPLSEDENWIYYETLRQMQLTSDDAQRQLAAALQDRRISELMREIRDKATADRVLLDSAAKQGTITADEHRKRLERLERQTAVRIGRFQDWRSHSEKFPLFVDVFEHPEEWQGKLVTLRGYVRRVVTFPGDAGMYAGQPLHELWLFTDDSQHNPAVIVTPSLPPDFPQSAEVVDRVTVTGCFFKPYVYRSDDHRRVAPLLLAGRISWNPTDDQLVSLAAEGALAADSPRLTAAVRRGDRTLSESAIMLLGFLGIVVMMAIWGRVQRDRRERRQLRLLVNSHHDVGQSFRDPSDIFSTSGLQNDSVL